MKSIGYARLKQDWIPLFVGIALTLLFVIFADPLYDLLYHGSDEFADQMTDGGIYSAVAIFTSLIVWGCAIIYYWILDRFPSILIWMLFYVLTLAIVPLVTFSYVGGLFDAETVPNLQGFCVMNMGVSFVFYFIVSLCVKNLSKNCATTPF